METMQTSDMSCTGSASRGFAVQPISPASTIINANNITAFLIFMFFIFFIITIYLSVAARSLPGHPGVTWDYLRASNQPAALVT